MRPVGFFTDAHGRVRPIAGKTSRRRVAADKKGISERENPKVREKMKVGDVLEVKLVWAKIHKVKHPAPPELMGYAPDGREVWFPREKIMQFKEGDVVRARIMNLHTPANIYLAQVESSTPMPRDTT